jgi:parallel beta-helix repeat protein
MAMRKIRNSKKSWVHKINKKFLQKKPFSNQHLVLFIFVFLIVGMYFIFKSSAAGETYYVDCVSGINTNSGTSPSSAWKTLSKVSSTTFSAGQSVLLKRGCTWNESLTINSSGTSTSPITFGAYGTGERPIITRTSNGIVSVGGSYVVIEDIYAKAGASQVDPNCQNNPIGFVVGFEMKLGSANNIVRNSKATGGYAGIYIRPGSHHNIVENNIFSDNISMSPLDINPDNDAGAFGVLLWGDDNEIRNNTISGHNACSYDYVGGDGSAVEIFGGQRNKIHHNFATDNQAFSELGHTRSSDNYYYYNTVTSTLATSDFLITRGGDDNRYGPINNTVVYNNSVYFTGSSSQGVICHGGCSSSVLTLKNNIIWANYQALYADAPFNESNNIFWKTGGSPRVAGGITISSTSKLVDPKYVNAASQNLHLLSTSPAINAGTTTIDDNDIDNETVPGGSTVDIGADEYYATPQDTIPPTVSITLPSSGSTVTATQLINANAADNVGVVGVQFKLDGSNIGSEDTSSPYSISWNSTSTANGSHNLTAVARDAAGNATTSTAISITVNNSSKKTGDLNNDGLVNIIDLSLLLSNYGRTRSQASVPACDINNDNIVNIFDLSTLLTSFGS